jgi:DNA sulfur modification protein DndD
MIIKSITIKNFKSFGNNKQTINFDINSGELILTSGKNGSGKTSFQQSFDFSLFGTVRGKNGKRIPQLILPNRINKNLETEIQFINNSSDNIIIQRNLEPNSAKIFINNIDETKRIKNLKKEDKDKIIGFDYETYKSFISLSVSDFANFIDLTPDEKRNIINKLFNLKDLDTYLNLTNGMIKSINEKKLRYETIIETNNQTINSLKQNIINIKRSGILDKEKEILRLEDEKKSRKEPYLNLKDEITECTDNIKKIDSEKQDLDNQKSIIGNDIFELKLELKNIEEKLQIYDSKICPFCDSDLTDKKHIHDLTEINKKHEDLKNNIEILENKKNDIILKLTQNSNKRDSYYKKKNNAITNINNLTFQLKEITTKIVNLKENNKNNISVDEITKNIVELEYKNEINSENILKLESDIETYEKLKEIFSNKGVRRNLIKNIIKPINVYLKDILDELKSQYNIKINEDFDVIIYERLTNEIHPESLSTGETKKINIAIALSYLKLILKFRKLNILFLDEVFSSMEPDVVELTLKILRGFTTEFNLNIIILDPEVYFTENSNINMSYFDRILKINKKLSFSNIE